jgi:hypothetical protein
MLGHAGPIPRMSADTLHVSNGYSQKSNSDVRYDLQYFTCIKWHSVYPRYMPAPENLNLVNVV